MGCRDLPYDRQSQPKDREQSAYDRWMDQTIDWEQAPGMLMGSVTVVITLLMLGVIFFDHPHGGGVGRLQPTAIERALRHIDAQLRHRFGRHNSL